MGTVFTAMPCNNDNNKDNVSRSPSKAPNCPQIDSAIESSASEHVASDTTPKVLQKSTCQDDEHVNSTLQNSVTFYLFSYRQNLCQKQRQMMKWATSKLLLTENLMRAQKQLETMQAEPEKDVIDLDDYLTDDEDVTNYVRKPPKPTIEEELTHLRKYSEELRDIIIQTAKQKEDRRMRRKDKKVKRLKRRTLISSKKPSNKREKRERDMAIPDMRIANKENIFV